MRRTLRLVALAAVLTAAVLVSAPAARAQRLPADTLHALVARMRANDLIGDSLRDRLNAGIAARRITLRSTLASRQHSARIEALTGMQPGMGMFEPMMSFDGLTGPTQAEWNERFVRSGLVTAAQVEQALAAIMASLGAPPRDSLLRVRTPVPFLGSVYEGLAAVPIWRRGLGRGFRRPNSRSRGAPMSFHVP